MKTHPILCAVFAASSLWTGPSPALAQWIVDPGLQFVLLEPTEADGGAGFVAAPTAFYAPYVLPPSVDKDMAWIADALSESGFVGPPPFITARANTFLSIDGVSTDFLLIEHDVIAYSDFDGSSAGGTAIAWTNTFGPAFGTPAMLTFWFGEPTDPPTPLTVYFDWSVTASALAYGPEDIAANTGALSIFVDGSPVLELGSAFDIGETLGEIYGTVSGDGFGFFVTTTGSPIVVELQAELDATIFGPASFGSDTASAGRYLTLAFAASGSASCPEDLDDDGDVDLADLTTLLSNFGSSGASPADGDIDGDTVVDLMDLALLLTAFGMPCP